MTWYDLSAKYAFQSVSSLVITKFGAELQVAYYI